MTRSFVIDPPEDDEGAGCWPAFLLLPRALRESARDAWLVLLLSALAVAGGASVVEPHLADTPAARPLAAVVVPVAPDVATRPEPEPLLAMPVRGVMPAALRDNFHERRGVRVHRALDIMAPRGTPVVAAADGTVARMYRHLLGGICLYQYDASGEFVYYYAHLDRYADGLSEGDVVKRGEIIGFVGSTGNASPTAPHLHFALIRPGPEGKWYRGTPVNPYPYLTQARTAAGP